MSYEDLKEHGSETAVKAAGKLRQQGKPYESEYRVARYTSYVSITVYPRSGRW